MSIKRNISIDLVKVVAMMCVMILHIPFMWRADDNLLAFTMSRSAGMAIPLFFMVSGFLLFGRKPDFRYSIKKIIGIIKFVVIISLTWTIGVCILKQQVNWHDILSAFYGPFIQEGILGVFWYLGAMCLIYAALPIINRYINNYPPPISIRQESNYNQAVEYNYNSNCNKLRNFPDEYTV